MIADELRQFISVRDAELRAARHLLYLLEDHPAVIPDDDPVLAEHVEPDPAPAAGIPRPEPVNCPDCGKTLKSQNGLGPHRKACPAQQVEELPAESEHKLTCDDCDYGTDDAETMARHTWAAHDRRPTKLERTPGGVVLA